MGQYIDTANININNKNSIDFYPCFKDPLFLLELLPIIQAHGDF